MSKANGRGSLGRALILPLGLAVSGCGGGGAVPHPHAVGIAEVVGRVQPLAPTPIDTPTPTTLVQYEGHAAFAPPPIGGDYSVLGNPSYSAELNMQADFATSSMSGQFRNFHAADGRSVAGSVDLADGLISGQQFSGAVSGSIDGRSLTGSVLDGRYLGPNYGAVHGFLYTELDGAVYYGEFVAD